MVYEFASTSKVSFPGSGVAAMATSKANIAFIKKQMGIQTIGYDKINQLRHVKFFKDFDGVKAHMMKHAALLRPKFDAVLSMLDKELKGCGNCRMDKTTGRLLYFIRCNGRLCKEGCFNV